MSENQHRYALKAGHKIHWYEIQRILGKGGFGITYEALDINLAKPVAIKEFLPSEFAVREADDSVHPISDESEGLFSWGLDRFISEARILSSFEHPNIVRVHAVFEENNTGYMVMAFENGKSFKALLKEQNPLDEQSLLNLFLPIIDGLEQVHEKGFIHRDIKPDNIYVRDNGSAVLLDFGSARQAVDGSQTMTSLVSPGYAPFEQYYPKGEEQGPWTDIYGLGATLYHAVTGQKPMDAVYRSRAMLDVDQNSQATAAELAKGRYSPAFLAAIDAAMEFRPGDRPQSLAEWRDQLQNLRPIASKQSKKPASSEAITKVEKPNDYSQANEKKGSIALKIALPSLAGIVALGAAGYFLLPSDVPSANTAPSNNPVTISTEQPDSSKRAEEEAQLKLAIEQEKMRLEAERLEAQRLEEERLEQERQQKLAEAEAKRIAEEKRLAEKKRQQAIAQRIQMSKKDFEARSAAKLDVIPYQDYTESKPLTTQRSSASYLVNAATKEWLNAGVTIERGKSYRITANGEWSMGSFCNSSDATGTAIYTLGCWDAGNQTVAGYSHGALIGKIGKETLAFYVGKQFEFTAGTTGTLYFMSNDVPAFIGDNNGNLNVSIELLPNYH